MSIELFLFPCWFSDYFCSVDVGVVSIVSGYCNQSSPSFLSLYRYIDSILNAG